MQFSFEQLILSQGSELEEAMYKFSETSSLFPVLGLGECITRLVERSKKTGRGIVMREFKAWLTEKLNKSID